MLCFIAGVGLRSIVPVDDFWLFFGWGAGAIALIVFSHNARAVLYAMMVLVSLGGALWYGRFEPAHIRLAPLAGKSVTLEAEVTADTEFRDAVQLLTVAPVASPQERIRVTAKRYPEFNYGDTVRVSGMLKKPENFSGFDYAAYLSKDGVYFTMDFARIALVKEGSGGLKKSLFALRRRFEENLQAALPFPHSAFAGGILLGGNGGMPKDLQDAFAAAGVSHVLALSGYNITVIIMFVSAVLSFFFVSRPIMMFFSVTVIIAFVLMTGASASAVRAAVMGVALMAGRYFGRQGRVILALVFAACLMIIFNPKILMFDIGFQFSFLAVLGLAYILPYLQEKTQRVSEFLKLKEALLATLSAQLAVLPLALYYFHQFSLVAPLANMLIAPLIPFAMLFGFAVGVAGFVSHALAAMLAYPLWAITAYQLWVVQHLGKFAYAAIMF